MLSQAPGTWRLALLLVALAALAPASAVAAVPGFVPDQLLVTFSEGATSAERAAVHRRAGGRVVDRIGRTDVEVVRVSDPGASLAAYAADRTVASAERDPIAVALHDDCVNACPPVTDPHFAKQWGLQNDVFTVQPPDTFAQHDADIDAPSAWQRTTGLSTTRIAILDSGIDLDHEDFPVGRVVASRNFTGSATLDDKYGHGTAVAGVAGAATSNGIGVAGTGYDASLMNVKVLDDAGVGSCSTVAKGITWATDNGANVINMSLGFRACRAGEQAVKDAWNRGVLMTAAAGNDGDTSRTYPAYYANVIAVAATDNADAKTSFSQHGSWVDIAAPGINVYTTFPNHPNQLGKNDYAYGKGTSMSAPIVGGAAALIWATPDGDANGDGRRNDDIRMRLETYADDIAGTGTYWSAGRLNVCNAAAASATACPLAR